MSSANFQGRRRRTRKNGSHEASEGRDRWLISYADLVTLLFALFVVLFAAADHERARSISSSIAAEFGESSTTLNQNSGVLPGATPLAKEEAAINRAFANNQTLGSRALVTRTGRGLVISLAEAGFFAPGEAALREDALSLVDTLADALRDSDAPLRIEGHTDSTPISSSRYPSNWELSTARAASVLAHLTARNIASARLSVAGYADERPIADNSTPEGRALNRRVDIVILSNN
jgi:chemotaxis protein MotB